MKSTILKELLDSISPAQQRETTIKMYKQLISSIKKELQEAEEEYKQFLERE